MPRISVNFQGANGTEKQVVHRLKQIHKLVGANENAFDSSVPVVDVAVDENYIAILYANGVLQRRSIKVVVDQSVKEEKSQEKKSHKERGKSKRMRLAMGAALQAAGSTREERLRRERESRMRQFAAQDIAVPEELISQVQSILRRPRASVVRELIRSNLDVNVAVNNLLSRDEDEEYVNEDARENAESGTVPAESASSGNPPPAVNEPVDKYSGQKGEFIPNDISQFMFPEHAEWHAQFSTIQPELSSKSVVCITAMKSELVIVTADGKLHQWKWACDKPYVLQKAKQYTHPFYNRISSKLKNMSVVRLESCPLRTVAEVILENNEACVVSFVDESFHEYEEASNLESYFSLSSIPSVRICDLQVCAFFVTFVTDSGECFWWGLLPFGVKTLELKSQKQDQPKQVGNIAVGSIVRMKSLPILDAGSIAMEIKDGFFVSAGKLCEPCWDAQDCDASIKLKFETIAPKSTLDEPASPANVTEENSNKRKMTFTTREQRWSMLDIVVVKPLKLRPYAKVIKVDGPVCLIQYDYEKENQSSNDMLGNTRMRNRNDLVLCTSDDEATIASDKALYTFPDVPKRLPIISHGSSKKCIAVACNSAGTHVYCLVSHATGGRVSVVSYSMKEAKVDKHWKFSSYVPPTVYGFMRPQLYVLSSARVPTFLITDGYGCPYVMSYDASKKSFKAPQRWFGVPTLKKLRINVCSLPNSKGTLLCRVVTTIVKDNPLLHNIMKGESVAVAKLINDRSHEELEELVHTSFTDGSLNLLHSIIHYTSMAYEQVAMAENARDASKNQPSQEKKDALKAMESILSCILSHVKMQPFIEKLLTAKNAAGMTPLVYSIHTRHYESSIRTLSQIKSKTLEMDALFPDDSPTDNSPLLMLCRNEQCSFRWTGSAHVQQLVYECKSCGLIGSLCCCTACAWSCHRFHECKIKRSSPTAYCDCSEKCVDCIAAFDGSKEKKFELWHQLCQYQKLMVLVNSDGENLLHFLINNAARKADDVKQYLMLRDGWRKAANETSRTETFSFKALSDLISNEEAVMISILSGMMSRRTPRTESSTSAEEQNCLSSQTVSVFLDRFVGDLILKVSDEHMVMLIKSLRRINDKSEADMLNFLTRQAVQVPRCKITGAEVVRRFFRSVVRISAVLRVQVGLRSGFRHGLTRKRMPTYAPVYRWELNLEKLFSAFPFVATDELADNIEALTAPLRFGIPAATALPSVKNAKDWSLGEIFEIATDARRNAFESYRSLDPVIGAQQHASDFLMSDGHAEAEPIEGSMNQSEIIDSNEEIDIINPMQPPMSPRPIEGDAEMFDGVQSNQGFEDSEEDDEQMDDCSDGDESTDGNEDDYDDEAYDIATGGDIPNDPALLGINSGWSHRDITARYLNSTSQPYIRARPPDGLSWAVSENYRGYPNQHISDATGGIGASARSLANDLGIRSHRLDQLTSRDKFVDEGPSQETTKLLLGQIANIHIRQIALLLDSEVCAEGVEIPKKQAKNAMELKAMVMNTLAPTFEWVTKILDPLEAKLRYGYALSMSEADTSIPASTFVFPPQNLVTSPGASIVSAPRGGIAIIPSITRRRLFSIPIPGSRAAQNASNASNYVSIRDQSSSAPGREGASTSAAVQVNTTTVGNTGSNTTAQQEFTSRNRTRVPAPPQDSDTSSRRRQNGDGVDFYQYLLSITRAHSSEHGEVMPVLNIESLRYVALVCDALLQLSRTAEVIEKRCNKGKGTSGKLALVSSLKYHGYFARDITLDMPGRDNSIDVFAEPLSKQLPLAERPYLLEADARPEDLFGPIKTEAPRRMGQSVAKFSCFAINEANNEFRLDYPPNLQEVAARWRYSLRLFTTNFLEDMRYVSTDFRFQPAFHVKEVLFRRRMEAEMSDVPERELRFVVRRRRSDLIIDTFKKLNEAFSRPTSGRNGLPIKWKLNVTFENEQGEGIGVTRSFFVALAEAFASNEQLPPGNSWWVDPAILSAKARESNLDRYDSLAPSRFRHVLGLRRHAGLLFPDEYDFEFIDSLRTGSSINAFDPGSFASLLTRHHRAQNDAPSAGASGSGSRARGGRSDDAARVRSQMARLSEAMNLAEYEFEDILDPPMDRIDLPLSDLRDRINEQVANRRQRREAEAAADSNSSGNARNAVSSSNANANANDTAVVSVATTAAATTTATTPVTVSSSTAPKVQGGDEPELPLFKECDEATGRYAPRPARISIFRQNAFRNFGRILGLALQTFDMFPIRLSRHVLNYILGRDNKFLDFGFFDPVMYESMRKLMHDCNTCADAEQYIESLGLTFVITIEKENGNHETVPLMPNGENTAVTKDNLPMYVRLLTSYKMVQSQETCLDCIQQGVLEVVPTDALSLLTPEDLSLFLCGNDRTYDVETLKKMTQVVSEIQKSHNVDEEKIKNWFWSIVEKMTTQEKHDLLFFWTGVPNLPAFDIGYQQIPSITLRPPDDQHFPTANTCISRLYLPAYSSKAAMKNKLLVAIKTKQFGFV